MALDYCQNFISAQYLENNLMELDQILHVYWRWLDLGWDCYTSIFANLQHDYGPSLLSKFCFRLKSCEQIDGIWSNFAYVLTLTRSRLDCLASIFANLQQLCPLVIVRISFPLYISNEQINGILPNFAYALTLTRSGLELIRHQFLQIYNMVMAPGYCQNFSYFQNFISASYLVKELMEFDQILHMHWPQPDLGWDCYTSIFANLQQVCFCSISSKQIDGIWRSFPYALMLTRCYTFLCSKSTPTWNNLYHVLTSTFRHHGFFRM